MHHRPARQKELQLTNVSAFIGSMSYLLTFFVFCIIIILFPVDKLRAITEHHILVN